MPIADELRDPWGWLIAGISGGLGWAVLATPLGPAAIVAGAGVGAVVLGTKVAIGASRPTTSSPSGQARDRLPKPPPGSLQRALVSRAEVALDHIDDLADRPGDQWIAAEVTMVRRQAEPVLSSLVELAGRVTLLDSSIVASRPGALASEVASVEEQVARATDPVVRREQERVLAALTGQSESVDRLMRRRDALLAQLQLSAVGLEGLATRTGELVALGSAGTDSAEAERIVSDLTGSLDAVRTGIDTAQSLLRDL